MTTWVRKLTQRFFLAFFYCSCLFQLIIMVAIKKKKVKLVLPIEENEYEDEEELAVERKSRKLAKKQKRQAYVRIYLL